MCALDVCYFFIKFMFKSKRAVNSICFVYKIIAEIKDSDCHDNIKLIYFDANFSAAMTLAHTGHMAINERGVNMTP